MADLSLAERRYNLGLTPEQLGEKVDISGRSIRRYEEGESRPGPAAAKRLADFLSSDGEQLVPSDLFPADEVPA